MKERRRSGGSKLVVNEWKGSEWRGQTSALGRCQGEPGGRSDDLFDDGHVNDVLATLWPGPTQARSTRLFANLLRRGDDDNRDWRSAKWSRARGRG